MSVICAVYSLAVYPRVCGGTIVGIDSPRAVGGLSPRVRGNRGGSRIVVGRERSIPACAGEPPRTQLQCWPKRVYPRVCGGTACLKLNIQTLSGLSPRVRGNHPRRPPLRPAARSIPACAGEPDDRNDGDDGREVYPRVCGGTVSWQGPGNGNVGLSPRVRGNHSRSHTAPARRRSIPACAGEPSPQRISLTCFTVYPRVCGGTKCLMRPTAFGIGLSPRVRGNRSPELVLRVIRRSIPACAGEPGTPTCPAAGSKVYPRVCGGTRQRADDGAAAEGLSPRVRGNLLDGGDADVELRSIPACAGEPGAVRRHARQREVYPRVCGGTALYVMAVIMRRGLSPRVRGNLDSLGYTPVEIRSIPACAGEPRQISLTHLGADGLSPRVRGNRLDSMPPTLSTWSIPACAGEPRQARCPAGGGRVYPRVCGGTETKMERGTMQGGLSPRVRGNRHDI